MTTKLTQEKRLDKDATYTCWSSTLIVPLIEPLINVKEKTMCNIKIKEKLVKVLNSHDDIVICAEN